MVDDAKAHHLVGTQHRVRKFLLNDREISARYFRAISVGDHRLTPPNLSLTPTSVFRGAAGAALNRGACFG
jgi:hypothetical protein